MPPHIVPSLSKTFIALHDERCFKGYDADKFSRRAGYLLGEINAVHPFRKGNGRTQREFLRLLAMHSGHDIKWSRISHGEMYSASHRSFQHGDNAQLEVVLRKAMIGENREQESRDRVQRRGDSYRSSVQPRQRERDHRPDHEY